MMGSRSLEAIVSRLTVLSVLSGLALVLMGCGGEKGVDNGTIVGKVFSDLQGNIASRQPESGVTVVIQRQETPDIIRTTLTDANGMYVFTDVPLGPYALGFAKEGFFPITTDAGSTSGQTAVGQTVRVVVDHHTTSLAPEVTLRSQLRIGNATVVFVLRDEFTGEPVTNATVEVGGVSTSENLEGVYTLSVPITRPDSTVPFGQPRQFTARITAEGFLGAIRTLNLFANQTIRETINLPAFSAETVSIRGVIRYERFQNVAPPYSEISVRVRNGNIQAPDVDDTTGIFTISGLPPSFTGKTRQIDLIISHPDYVTQEVRGITLPIAGLKDLTNQPIFLEPVVVDLIGTVSVLNDVSDPPTEQIPNGTNDKVIIEETGQVASIINGTFLIPDVPVQQGENDNGLTLLLQAQRPNSTLNFCTTVQGVKPTSDGTDSAVFTLRKIVLSTQCDDNPVGGGGG